MSTSARDFGGGFGRLETRRKDEAAGAGVCFCFALVEGLVARRPADDEGPEAAKVDAEAEDPEPETREGAEVEGAPDKPDTAPGATVEEGEPAAPEEDKPPEAEAEDAEVVVPSGATSGRGGGRAGGKMVRSSGVALEAR